MYSMDTSFYTKLTIMKAFTSWVWWVTYDDHVCAVQAPIKFHFNAVWDKIYDLPAVTIDNYVASAVQAHTALSS